MHAFSLLVALGCGLSLIVACSGKAVESSSASAGSAGSEESGGSTAGTSAGGYVGIGGTSQGGNVGIGGTSPYGGAGGRPNHPPETHRASATACDHIRATSDPAPPGLDAGSDFCHSDAECTAGENGRCVGVRFGSQCNYDACFADSDCQSDAGAGPQLCACGTGNRFDNNVCLPGNCRVDADCGAAGFCSPTLGSCGNYTSFVGYYCHTPNDECTDDSDCHAGGSSGAYCAFMSTLGYWRCSTDQCVG